MAANRIGKSFSGAAEMSYHLTGIYPEWWEGKRYDQPITAWAGGVSNETTRDIVQYELLGSPDDPDAFGSGAIPKNKIIKTERKPGVPNAKSVALIQQPITAWAGGVSNETTRDIVQYELLGSPDDPDAFGSGAIPKNKIIKTERKPGVPNAKSVALIQ